MSTDHTFNPWIGCTKVSPACDHCYAERSIPAKLQGIGWGPHAERRRTSPANWKLPLRWNAQAEAFHAQHGRRQRVFCASLADVFDNAVPAPWRMDLFTLIGHTPDLDWLLLTKRIGNVMPMSSGDSLMFDMICDRIWLGATICNQEEADRDIPKLTAVPAAKRFLSIEPLLGPVDLNLCDCDHGSRPGPNGVGGVTCPKCGGAGGRRVDWVIVGGESGPNARPMHPDWVRSLRDQCNAAGVPFFFKQWGSWRPPLDGEPFDTSMGRAQKPPTFIVAPDGTVHCFQGQYTHGGAPMLGVGKKAAGRLLDGREWNEVPA